MSSRLKIKTRRADEYVEASKIEIMTSAGDVFYITGEFGGLRVLGVTDFEKEVVLMPASANEVRVRMVESSALYRSRESGAGNE